jgi:Fe-S cluster assembly iron-binding protein IscA
MEFSDMLDQCRGTYATVAAATRRTGLFSRLKRSLGRDIAAELGISKVPFNLDSEYRLLLDHGSIVWGTIVQANNGLYGPGQSNLPALTLFSTDRAFDAAPARLRELANHVAALKDSIPAEADLRPIAEAVTDETNRTTLERLPPSMAASDLAWVGRTIIFRSQLPSGFLSHWLLPMIVCPDRTPESIVLPLRYWPASLSDQWLADVPALVARSNAAQRSLSAATPRISAEQYTANPVRLSESAANAVRQVIREQRLNPRATALLVGRKSEGLGRHFTMDVTEQPFDHQAVFVTECFGVRVVVEREIAVELSGLIINYGPRGSVVGFTFDEQGDRG